jgi:predicted MFS family arabinose efflux permease
MPIVLGGICTGLGCLGLALWLSIPETSGALAVQMPILASSAICGVGIALASAAMQAVPPRLSSPDERGAALSLNFLPTALARTVGPVAGASLSLAVGSVPTLAIVGGVCLLASSIFLFLPRLRTRAKKTVPQHRLKHVLGHLRTDRPLIAVLAAVAAIGAGSEAAITLAPSIGNLLGIGAAGAGWITAAFGAGGLVGVIGFRVSVRFFPTQMVGCSSMMVMGASMAVLGATPPLPLATTLLVLAGASMVMSITGFSILAQQRSPAPFLGRVMALWVMAFTGVRPVAGLALGFVSDHASTTAALITAGATTVAATAGVYLGLGGTKLDDAEIED